MKNLRVQPDPEIGMMQEDSTASHAAMESKLGPSFDYETDVSDSDHANSYHSDSGDEEGSITTTSGDPIAMGKQLGEGTYGVVHRIKGDPDSVIKISDFDGIGAFEIKALKRMNLLKSVGITRANDGTLQQALVLQRSTGRNLNKLKKLKSRAEVEEIYQKAKSLLDYMHEQDIIHGDLHEGNIMYDRLSGDVNIVDFGSAKDISKFPAAIKKFEMKKDYNQLRKVREYLIMRLQAQSRRRNH